MAINIFTASGNIGRDCEVRVTPNSKSIGFFPLPVKQGYGEHEKTSWVNCKIFGALAEKMSQYLTKGKKVTVSGEFVLEKWTAQDGTERSNPVIIVRDIDLGGSPQQQPNQGYQPQSQQHQAAQSQQHYANTQQQPQNNGLPAGDEWNDDIPF